MKKIFSSLYRPSSLRFRITALVLVISLIVMIAATAFINNRAITVMEQNSNERLNTASSTLATTVSVWLEPHLNALKTLVSLPDIISMDAERQKPFLQKMAAAYPYMYLISTTDLNGMNVARNDNEKPKDYSDREWFQKTRDGSAVTFESLIGKTSHKPALVIAMAIKNEAGRVVGIGMFATVLEHLAYQVRVTKAGKTGFAYLIDHKNRVIAHPDPVYANSLRDFSAYPPVKALREGTRGLVSFVDETGVSWRAYVNELDNGWGVVVQEQEEELLSTQRLFQRVALTIIFIAVLIMISSTWWSVKRALKPINTLTEAVKKVTPANMSRLNFEFVHRSSLNSRTKDEVGTLADSFYKMAVKLQATLASLEQELTERKRTEQELKKHRDSLEGLIRERTTELRNSNEQLNREIEERKNAEVALRESQQMLRLVLDSIPARVFWKDKELNYLGCNQQFANDSGYKSPEEIIGKNDFAMGWAEQAEIYRSDDRMVIESGAEKLNYEEPQTTPDGRKIWLRTSKMPLIDAQGRVKGVLGTYEDITDSKRAEHAIKESEERYRLLAENAHDIIFTMDVNLRFTYISPSITRIRGFTVEEAMSQTPAEALTPASLEVAMNVFLEELEIEARDTKDLFRTRTIELEETCKDGSTLWTETTFSTLRDENYKFTGFLGITRDITDRKKAEEALRESEQRLQIILHGSPVSTFVIGRDHRVIHWNEALEQLSRVSAKDIIGTKEHWRAFYGIERPCMADLIVDGALEAIPEWYSGKYSKSELIDEAYEATDFFPALGEKGKWLRFTAAAIRNSSGDLVGAIETLEDITKRKFAEQALVRSERKYRELYSNLRDGSASVGMDGTIIEFNEAFQEMLGYSKEEIFKLTYEEITPEKWHTHEATIIEQQVMKRGYSDIYEKEYRRKDGTIFPIELQTYLIRGEKGTPIGMWAFVRDITDRKRVEEEKKRLEDQLTQAQKMESIGTLAGGIAHDFNNLLTGILGNVSLALMNMDENNPLFERLKNVQEYVQRGSDLTKQLLGFARGGKYEVKPTHLGEFIRRSSEMFGRTKKEIRIHHKIQDELWTVEVDRGQMEQVLLNLYVNAWQAMPGGGDLYLSVENIELNTMEVNPYDIESGRFVKVSVADTGIGMDEAIKARVFEPFFTTKELGRGTGLGLASAYGIIKNHGGFITVESEKDLGTSFMIYLPASKKVIEDEYTSKDEVKKGRETILLIDDEDMILDVGAKMLEGLGYEVITATGGRRGLEIYEKNRDGIDLVILDMIMPDFGGKKTFEHLRRIDQSVRVLLSSGYSLNSQAEEIMQSGCNGFIQKPFTIMELSKKIRGILDEHVRGSDKLVAMNPWAMSN